MVVLLLSIGIVSTLLIYHRVFKNQQDELHKFCSLRNLDIVVAQDGTGDFMMLSAAVTGAASLRHSSNLRYFLRSLQNGCMLELSQQAPSVTNNRYLRHGGPLVSAGIFVSTVLIISAPEMRELGSRRICGRVPAGQPVSFRFLSLLTVGCADEEVQEGSVTVKMSLRRKNYRFEGATPVITYTGEAPDFVYVNLPLNILSRPSDWQLLISQILPHFSSCLDTRQQVGNELLFFGLDMGRVAGIFGYKKLIKVSVEELVQQNTATDAHGCLPFFFLHLQKRLRQRRFALFVKTSLQVLLKKMILTLSCNAHIYFPADFISPEEHQLRMKTERK